MRFQLSVRGADERSEGREERRFSLGGAPDTATFLRAVLMRVTFLLLVTFCLCSGVNPVVCERAAQRPVKSKRTKSRLAVRPERRR